MNRLASVAVALLASGCVLDRTGQSASELYRRELALQGARVTSLEDELVELSDRTSNLEQLNQARGQQEIMKMETLEQVREEVYRMRGELEELRFTYNGTSKTAQAAQTDAAFRLAWLESRADQLEEKLDLAPPPPPELEEPAEGAQPGAAPSGAAAGAAGAATTDTGAESPAPVGDDPDSLIAGAEAALARGDEPAAEALLDSFLASYPKHDRAAEARYRRAEASFNAKQFAQAVLRFQEVIDKHKDSQWAAWAMLRQGESFDAQGQPDNAKLFYEDVVRYWPKSKAATEARRKLK